MRQVLKLSILIVDDHLLIRLGLKQVRGQEFRDVVFGEAETAAEALTQIKARPWRLVILDVGLPDDDDGFSVLQEVCARRPQAAVLVLGMPPDSQYAARSLQLGASGYISKSSGRSDLLKAVSNVLDGKKDFSESRIAGEFAARDLLLSTKISQPRNTRSCARLQLIWPRTRCSPPAYLSLRLPGPLQRPAKPKSRPPPSKSQLPGFQIGMACASLPEISSDGCGRFSNENRAVDSARRDATR